MNTLVISGDELILKYPQIENDKWNETLDRLNESDNIYNKIRRIYLETNFIFELPKNFMKFIDIKELEINGSRWWNLRCNQIPPSVEILKCIEHSNLSTDFLIGSETLVNLREIYLDLTPYINYNYLPDYPDPELDLNSPHVIPLSNLITLKKIVLIASFETFDEAIFTYNDYDKLIRKLKLLENVKERIISINPNAGQNYNGWWSIEIILE